LVFAAAVIVLPVSGQNVTFLADIGGNEELDNASSAIYIAVR
jgi:hypothetical protein